MTTTKRPQKTATPSTTAVKTTKAPKNTTSAESKVLPNTQAIAPSSQSMPPRMVWYEIVRLQPEYDKKGNPTKNTVVEYQKVLSEIQRIIFKGGEMKQKFLAEEEGGLRTISVDTIGLQQLRLATYHRLPGHLKA